MQLTAISNLKSESLIFQEPKEFKAKESNLQLRSDPEGKS